MFNNSKNSDKNSEMRSLKLHISLKNLKLKPNPLKDNIMIKCVHCWASSGELYIQTSKTKHTVKMKVQKLKIS